MPDGKSLTELGLSKIVITYADHGALRVHVRVVPRETLDKVIAILEDEEVTG